MMQAFEQPFLLWRYQQILAPSRALQPALAAQGTDDFVGGLEAGAQEFDDVGAGYLALPAFSLTQAQPGFPVQIETGCGTP